MSSVEAPVRAKVVFLDVDGTYAHRGMVPDGHVAAVRAARAAGHRVLLCTGRPRCLLPERILAAGFDGIVASAGGWVQVGDEVLVDTRFPAELVARVLPVLDRHDVAYILEAPDALHARPGTDRRLAAVREEISGPVTAESPRRGPDDVLTALRMSDDLRGASFGKITYLDSPVSGEQLVAEVGEGIGALPSSIAGLGRSAGELHLLGVHKAVGIQVVTDHLGLTREDTVAFGDGANDLEMLAHAGVGVAIAGAAPGLLAVADRVAAGPEEEGLVAAFADLGLTP